MSLVCNLLRSSVGRKFLMAVTGFILVAFVTGHLVGNLQIFAHPDKINGYAHFLQSLGPALWVVRLTLLACAVIHVWAAATLSIENYQARGPERYGVHKWLAAAVASRYMKVSGVVVGVFIVYHLLHFTTGQVQSATFKAALTEYHMTAPFALLGFPIVAEGAHVHDVWSMVYLGFANPVVSVVYVIGIALLTLHLWHGADAMFQSVGLRNEKWSSCLRRVVGVYCLLYLLGNVAMPAAVLTGAIKPPANTAAAKIATCCATPSATTQAHR